MTINLTEGIEDSFEFQGEVDGKIQKYKAIYPNSRKLRAMQLAYAKLNALNEKAKNEIPDKEKKQFEADVKEATDEISKEFNELFVPLEDSLPIDEFIDKLPVPARKNFEKMITEDLLGA
ncbi:MAG: hypothetical protein IJ122_06415 [Methanobrevibacter sp.]|nr:hypothetical protein [Methanobrevibacter sp.]